MSNTLMQSRYDQLLQAKTRIVENGSTDEFRALLADDVTLNTPRFFKPVKSHEHFLAIIQGILTLLPDFKWNRFWGSDNELVLEFMGHVNGGKTVAHGIDIVEFDKQGKISSLTVFIRPTSALEEIAVGEDAMVAKLMGGG